MHGAQANPLKRGENAVFGPSSATGGNTPTVTSLLLMPPRGGSKPCIDFAEVSQEISVAFQTARTSLPMSADGCALPHSAVAAIRAVQARTGRLEGIA